MKKLFLVAMLVFASSASFAQGGLAPSTLGPYLAGSTAVAAGSGPGWVSGDIKSMAASTVNTVIWDLGALWHQYPVVALMLNPQGPSTGLNPVQCWNTATAAIPTGVDLLRRALPALAAGVMGTINLNALTVTGPQQILLRSADRYLVCSATNSDIVNATGALASIGITLYNR